MNFRQKKLEESEEFQHLIANIQEEKSWISEKTTLVSSQECGDSLAAVQGSTLISVGSVLRVMSFGPFILVFTLE